MLKKFLAAIIALPFVLLVAVALSAFMALPVKWLYNYLAPGELWDITFRQAWALSLLCGLLFKSSK